MRPQRRGPRVSPEETARRVAEALALPLPERWWYHYAIGARRFPTERELVVFLAVVEHGDERTAARALGLAYRSIQSHLQHLYTAIGARDRTHAAWLLGRRLKDRYVLPGDAPRRLRVVA